jgi:hypothetical protein
MSSYATTSSTKISNSSIAGICTKNALSRNLVGESSRHGNMVEKEDEEDDAMDEETRRRMEKIVKEVESGTEESDSDCEFGRYLVETEQKQAILDDSLTSINVGEDDSSTSSAYSVKNNARGTDFSHVSNKNVVMEGPNPSISTEAKSPSPNSKPHGRAGDPHYLNEFYNNSRLHHLSTWKSEWREYVNKKSKELTDFPGRQALIKVVSEQAADLTSRDMSGDGIRRTVSGKPKRVVMHVDMDCFFVSVGLRKRPDLIGEFIFDDDV